MRNAGIAAIFLLSLGTAIGGALAIVLGGIVAPVCAAHLLLRHSLVAVLGQPRWQLGATLWIALNAVPVLLLGLQSWPAALLVATKSACWMAAGVMALRLCVASIRPGGAARLLGIGAVASATVLCAGLVLAPSQQWLACPGGACLRPVAGFSVTLLSAFDGGPITVEVPPLAGKVDAME